MQITKVNCPTYKYNIKCPYHMNPEYIVVHNTANDASAMSEISYMLGNNRYTSFHYAVDDYRVVQGIEENCNAFHAGDGANGPGNRKGIAVEICYSRSGGDRFIKAELLAAKFIALKLKEKGWNIDRVKKHQDFSRKYCPHRTLDLGWERFLNFIKLELGQSQTVIPNPTTPNIIELYKVKITTPDLRIRASATTNSSIVGHVHEGEVYTIVEESNGWGKLKSGLGWIYLAYTSRNLTAIVYHEFTLRVTKRLAMVRVGPSCNYNLGGSKRLHRGNTFVAVAAVKGQNVNGNNIWYKSKKGNYVWSGGLVRI